LGKVLKGIKSRKSIEKVEEGRKGSHDGFIGEEKPGARLRCDVQWTLEKEEGIAFEEVNIWNPPRTQTGSSQCGGKMTERDISGQWRKAMDRRGRLAGIFFREQGRCHFSASKRTGCVGEEWRAGVCQKKRTSFVQFRMVWVLMGFLEERSGGLLWGGCFLETRRREGVEGRCR